MAVATDSFTLERGSSSIALGKALGEAFDEADVGVEAKLGKI
jgi:hypothetical protein